MLFPGGGFTAFAAGEAGFFAAVAASESMAGIGTLTSVIGASLVLQGVSDMLFPVDDSIDEEDPRISFSFSGVQNTSRAGTSHPIVYGEIVTGSVVISAGIDTHQVSA